MRRSLRNVFAVSCLVLTACSLVVDFPEKKRGGSGDDDTSEDGGSRPDASALDASDDGATPGRDAGADARPDAMSVPDASGGECSGNGECDSDELCCDRKDGKGTVCIATTNTECSACGAGCMDPAAPNCGARECECQAGSGKACANGQKCLGSGADARCVDCTEATDCGSGKLCVDNKCVQCSRGDDADSSADDEGCGGATPICGANNTCVGCSARPNNCPSGQQCVAGAGCFGCSPTARLGSNGCSRTTPICKPSGSMYQCARCERNADCAGGYCDTATGACNSICSPQAPPAMNGCPARNPYCRSLLNTYRCEPCTALDCSNGRFCATGDHPLAGSCVQCRTNADCLASAPVCVRNTGLCTGCTGEKNVFNNADGQCVECLSDGDCGTEKGGSYCHPTMKECVRCGMLPMPNAACADRNAATPTCNTMSGLCAGCTEDADCTASPTAPLCVNGTCSPCDALSGNAPDMRCSRIGMNKVCLANGACSPCDPANGDGCMGMQVCVASASGNQCQTCDPATDRPCGGMRPQCALIMNMLTCAECDPAAAMTGCAAGSTCTAMGTCMTDAPPDDAGVDP